MLSLPVMSVWAIPRTTETIFVGSDVNIKGYYNCSWDVTLGKVELQNYNILPANLRGVICIYLDALPADLYYDWTVRTNAGSVMDYQIQPDNVRCYVGFNGAGNETIEFNIKVMKRGADNLTGLIVTERTLRFYVPD